MPSNTSDVYSTEWWWKHVYCDFIWTAQFVVEQLYHNMVFCGCKRAARLALPSTDGRE